MSQKKKKNIKVFIPLILVELWIALTYGLYRFGIWVFPGREDVKLFVYIALYMVAFFLGYYIYILKIKKKTQTDEEIIENTNIPQKYLITLCIINGIMLIPFCLTRTGSIIPPIGNIVLDFGGGYYNGTEAVQNLSVLHYVAAVGRPLLYFGFIITYYCWKQLNSWQRVVFLFETIWLILVEMGTGHNKGIFLCAIILIIMYLSWLCSNKKIVFKKIWPRSLVTVLALIIMPLYFNSSLGSRANSTIAEIQATGQTGEEIIMNDEKHKEMIEEQYKYVAPKEESSLEEQEKELKEKIENEIENEIENADELALLAKGIIPESVKSRYDENKGAAEQIHPYFVDGFSYSYVDIDSILYRMIPERLKFLTIVGGYYISHGYYAMSLGLRMPFDCSFGAGTFPIIQNTFQNVTGIDLYSRTYVYKINHAGYPVSLKWATAFVQFASDVSFIGVILIMGMLGMLTASLWIEAIVMKKLLPVFVLAPLGYCYIMLPSWWMPGMAGSEFLLLNGPLSVWIIIKICKFHKKRLLKHSQDNKVE